MRRRDRDALTSDPPEYGDRKRTTDRRTALLVRVQPTPDRRRTYPGAGRDARIGQCRECGERTSSVVFWNGKVVYLCPPCGREIREA
jgi:hypothetical protein